MQRNAKRDVTQGCTALREVDMGESSSALRLALLAPTPAIRASEVSDFYARLPHLRRLDLAGQVLLLFGRCVTLSGEVISYYFLFIYLLSSCTSVCIR